MTTAGRLLVACCALAAVLCNSPAGASDALAAPEVTYVPGASTVTASWTAPVGSVATTWSYEVVASTGATCTTAQLTCNITGFTQGASPTFSVVATGSEGNTLQSPSSLAITYTGVTLAPAPVAPVAVYVDGAPYATVYWTPPSSTPANTFFTVNSVPAGQTCTVQHADKCDVHGLIYGQTSTFTVTASSANGPGGTSAPTNSITFDGLTAPGAPVNPTATYVSNSSSVTVQWQNSPVNYPLASRYTVSSEPAGFTCHATTTSCTLTDLTNAATYSFTVTATNAVGTSAASLPTTPFTYTGDSLPSAVNNLATLSNDTSMAVTWTVPSVNVPAASSYRVSATPGNATCTTTTLSCTLTGLKYDETYVVNVVAVNAVGSGPAASTSALYTGQSSPSAVRSVTAMPDASGTGEDISWLAPTSTNPEVADYVATAVPGGSSCTTTALTCVISNLTSGVTYRFIVAAQNPLGITVTAPYASALYDGTSGTDAPQAITATQTSGSTPALALAWTAPTAAGAWSYAVSVNGSVACTTAVSYCTVTQAVEGNGYVVTVTATSTDAAGSASTFVIVNSNAVPSPTLTPQVHYHRGDTVATVTWESPVAIGPQLSYVVTSLPSGVGCVTTASTCTVRFAHPGNTYRFIVTPRNAHGIGSASTSSDTVTVETAPGAPTPIHLTRHGNRVTLTWGTPATYDTPVTGYLIATVPSGAASSGHTSLKPVTVSTATHSFSELVPVGTWKILISATSTLGPGKSASATVAAPRS